MKNHQAKIACDKETVKETVNAGTRLKDGQQTAKQPKRLGVNATLGSTLEIEDKGALQPKEC